MSEPTPPTQLGDLAAFSDSPQRPGWPKAIGITSIVIGGLFVCCGACGLIQLARGPQPVEGMTPPPQTPLLGAVMQVVGFFMSIVLLVAGILLVNRKEAGRWLHLIYAIVSIPTGLVGMFVTVALFIAAIPMLYNIFLLIWFGFVKRKADLGAREDFV